MPRETDLLHHTDETGTTRRNLVDIAVTERNEPDVARSALTQLTQVSDIR